MPISNIGTPTFYDYESLPNMKGAEIPLQDYCRDCQIILQAYI